MQKKMISICLAAAMIVTGGYVENGIRAEAATTIGGLHYTFSSLASDSETSGNNTDYTLKKTKYGSKKDGYKFTTGSARLYASIDGSSNRKLEWSTDTYLYSGKNVRQPAMTAGKKNPWKAGTKPYFEIRFSTSGYSNVSFSAYLGATKKGPKNFQAAYAVGNSNSFTNISGASLALSDNKKMQKLSVTLPKATLDKNQVKIRIFVSSLKAINGSSLTADATSGEAAINHISITGTKKSAASKVTKVGLNKAKLSLKKGKSATLLASVTVSPYSVSAYTAAKKKLTWSSSNKKVAVVSKAGKVTAKKKGTAVITVSYQNSKKAKCKVTVK